MKKSRLSLLAIPCLICAIALSIFATSVTASTTEFGLQEFRKAREDGAQYGYRIIDKNIWKIVVYNGETIDYDKAIYCLKAEQGFYTSEPGVFRQEYDLSYNFFDKASMSTLPVADEYYNSIVWILNHSYIPNAQTAEADKNALLQNAGITGRVELTDDDLEVIAQLAIWYFTNADDTTYHTDFNGEPSLQRVFEAKQEGGEITEDYISIRDKNEDRYLQMETLFKYFVTNAKNATETENTNVAPVSLMNNKPEVTLKEDNYIIGPYRINKENEVAYTLQVQVTDRKDKNLDGKYTVLNGNKEETTQTITDMVGQEFYLKIPVQTVKEEGIDGIKLNISGTYTTTEATYWTNSENNTVQPLVVIEKVPQDFSDGNEVGFPVSGEYSLKLIKVDSQDSTKTIAGAEFEITTPNGTETYTTNENGEIVIDKIDITEAGTDQITIKETKAPEPYKMLLNNDLVINVTKDLVGDAYTATDATIDGYDKNLINIQDGVITITVTNEQKIFDLALKKWVSKSIVTNEDGTETVTETGHTGDENPEEPAKVDLGRQNIDNVVVKFEFQIKITNEGEVAGYAKEITDYIPEGLEFVAEDNPDWYERESDSNGRVRVATKQLENTLLEPGESATVSIILTWVNGQDNMGLKTNIAEISQDDNEYDLPDIDSTPDNFKDGEDDIDDAPVMLTVALGGTKLYLGLTAVVVGVLAVGVFLIKKYAI